MIVHLSRLKFLECQRAGRTDGDVALRQPPPQPLLPFYQTRLSLSLYNHRVQQHNIIINGHGEKPAESCARCVVFCVALSCGVWCIVLFRGADKHDAVVSLRFAGIVCVVYVMCSVYDLNAIYSR